MPGHAKFRRAGRNRDTKLDHRGSVTVAVNLRSLNGSANYEKGNIGRALTVKGAKVSEVFAANAGLPPMDQVVDAEWADTEAKLDQLWGPLP